jgi:hypothetical protein
MQLILPLIYIVVDEFMCLELHKGVVHVDEPISKLESVTV